MAKTCSKLCAPLQRGDLVAGRYRNDVGRAFGITGGEIQSEDASKGSPHHCVQLRDAQGIDKAQL